MNPVEKVTEEFLDDELEWKKLKPGLAKKEKKKREKNLSPILEEKKVDKQNMSVLSSQKLKTHRVNTLSRNMELDLNKSFVLNKNGSLENADLPQVLS